MTDALSISIKAASSGRASSSLFVLLWLGHALVSLQGAVPVNVLTYHNDNGRTGLNPDETILTPGKVTATGFGKLFSYPVDGYYYAQPLYVPGVAIAGRGTHNVVFVTTEHDSVYAFDADSNQGDNATPLWHVSFIDPAAGFTTMPITDLGLTDSSGTEAELGITGTPVIDPSTGTLFVVAKIKDTRNVLPRYSHRLYALDIRSGAAKYGGPVEIQASARGTGWGSDELGNIAFNSLYQFQRPGLLLVDGTVYVGFASAGDIGTYHGWILGYDAGTGVTFNVGAGGSPPFRYQWRFKGKDLDGATNAWLSLTNVPASGAGDYTVTVANSYDTTLSEAARLIVNFPPVPPKLTINSQLEIALEGDPGRGYAIEYLADLDLQQNDWIVLTTLTLTNATQTVTDPQGTNAERRFYRAVADPF